MECISSLAQNKNNNNNINLGDRDNFTDENTLYKLLDYDDFSSPKKFSELDLELINHLINQTELDNETGRLIIPILWNKKLKHLLPNNFHLANCVLKSTLKKYKNEFSKLEAYNDVITDQLENGIIQPVENIQSLKNNNNISFLAHNAVFRENVETTKCRVVYLSNLCDKNKASNLSHNNISLPGPNLNNRLDVAITLMRFNKFLLIFDLEKAFHQIKLPEEDTEKLHFLWFKNIKQKDFSIVAYKLLRLPFGMRCSPSILMIALYIILILHVDIFDQFEWDLRKSMFNLSYMDNIAYASSTENDVILAYQKAHTIFNSYGFQLQQFQSNSLKFQGLNYDELHDNNTNENVSETKLLGMLWDTNSDTLYNKDNKLNPEAKTLRSILSSINSLFDPLNLGLPGRNRAKLFLHNLQNGKNINWDTKLDNKTLKEYKNICSQYNNSKKPVVSRYIGDYNSTYNIVAFTDASKDIYGTVLYLQEVGKNKLHFLCAKNKVIPTLNSNRSIPVLELFAVKLGVQFLLETLENLSSTFTPLKINDLHLYTDSTVTLNWIMNKVAKLNKVERKGTIINNQLNFIEQACEKHPITFHHCNGSDNPSDCVTRCISYKVLLKNSIYLNGPLLNDENELLTITVPYPLYTNHNNIENFSSYSVQANSFVPLFKLDRFSSFEKLCKTAHFVRKFIHTLKVKVHEKTQNIFPQLDLNSKCSYEESCNIIIRQCQQENFLETYNYLKDPIKNKETLLVTQLNLFLDKNNVIRVKSKFANLKADFNQRNPILLHKHHTLTSIIIKELHVKMKHAGIYKMLAILRKEFYIPIAYSVVKKNIKDCLKCKQMYGRPIQINQNQYKEYRINPSQIPFREVFLDHIGPFNVKINNNVEKVHILILTCIYTRAVNLLLCKNVDNKCFISAFQFHVFDFGIPQLIISDQGSSIVSSVNIVKKFLEDSEVKNYLTLHNIKNLEFSPYPAKASFLGGLVESLVKQTKNIIYSAIGKNILEQDEFALLVKETNMLINKRPLAFKSVLINPDSDPSIPFSITPEILLKGYEVPAMVVSPHLYQDSIEHSDDPDWSPSETDQNQLYLVFQKYRKVKTNLNNLYYNEFLSNLKYLATNKSDRYKTKNHTALGVGDIIAIKEQFCKPYFYNMGTVTELIKNDLGEVVSVKIRKTNLEVIIRHVSDIILLLKRSGDDCNPETVSSDNNNNNSGRPQRKAAAQCKNLYKNLITKGQL